MRPPSCTAHTAGPMPERTQNTRTHTTGGGTLPLSPPTHRLFNKRASITPL